MVALPPKDSKSRIRDEIRTVRSAMSREEVEAGSRRIQDHLSRWLDDQDFAAVAAYMAVRNEPVIHPAMELDQHHDRRWYFPRVVANGGMEFVAWRSYEPVRKGKFGIKEPVDGQHLHFADRQVVMFLPCVAVDRQGTRLGSGAGYYDRFLKSIEGKSSVTLIGICWDRFCLQEPLPVESFDVPVHFALTENGFTVFKGGVTGP